MDNGKRRKTREASFLLILCALLTIASPGEAGAEQVLLKRLIIKVNEQALRDSLLDGSYRGEAGILNLGPEQGQALGLAVHTDRDYLDSVGLFLIALLADWGVSPSYVKTFIFSPSFLLIS